MHRRIQAQRRGRGDENVVTEVEVRTMTESGKSDHKVLKQLDIREMSLITPELRTHKESQQSTTHQTSPMPIQIRNQSSHFLERSLLPCLL